MLKHSTRSRLAVFAAMICASSTFDLSLAAAQPVTAEQLCLPDNNRTGVRSTPVEYAKMIEPYLGVPPVVDCGAGVEMPIFVDGVKTAGDPGVHACDNPSLQMGDCMSGSSLQRYEGVTADGSSLPDVVWVSFCRHDGRDDVVNFDMPDSVQLIGYHRLTGATAFFESGDNKSWLTVDPTSNRLTGVLPSVDDPAGFDKAFSVPGQTQCVICHQADPFIHNAFVDGAKMPGNPNQTVLPVLSSEWTNDPPYYPLGGADWDMRTIDIPGNQCLDCHRIGFKTLEDFMQDGWHPNDHMPPREPGSLSADFAQLETCWKQGPENTPGCDWVIPPAAHCDRQVVGEDYPFKFPHNQPAQVKSM